MKFEVLITRRSTVWQHPVVSLSRHDDGFKLYLPGVFVAVNNVKPTVDVVGVGIESGAAEVLDRLPIS